VRAPEFQKEPLGRLVFFPIVRVRCCTHLPLGTDRCRTKRSCTAMWQRAGRALLHSSKSRSPRQPLSNELRRSLAQYPFSRSTVPRLSTNQMRHDPYHFLPLPGTDASKFEEQLRALKRDFDQIQGGRFAVRYIHEEYDYEMIKMAAILGKTRRQVLRRKLERPPKATSKRGPEYLLRGWDTSEFEGPKYGAWGVFAPVPAYPELTSGEGSMKTFGVRTGSNIGGYISSI
jgi:hypothetical protein